MPHSFSQIYIHAVWTVKSREPLLRKKLRYALWEHIFEKAPAINIEVVAVGGIEDHVHILFRLPSS